MHEGIVNSGEFAPLFSLFMIHIIVVLDAQPCERTLQRLAVEAVFRRAPIAPKLLLRAFLRFLRAPLVDVLRPFDRLRKGDRFVRAFFRGSRKDGRARGLSPVVVQFSGKRPGQNAVAGRSLSAMVDFAIFRKTGNEKLRRHPFEGVL